MAGIVGIIGRASSRKNKEDVTQMVNSIRHEVFYESGEYESKDEGIYLGWTCHPDGASMPVSNRREDVALIMTGEAYFDSKGAHDLKYQRQESTFNYLNCVLDLYEQEGEDAFSELNGCFAGVLIDKRRKVGFLFTDRFGMERLFFHQAADRLIFASEAKALLKILPETRYIDPVGLAEIVTCGATLGSNSLFRAIEVVPRASLWVINNAAVTTKKKYFASKEWENLSPLDPEIYVESVTEAFAVAVRKCSSATRPIGVSLTAGYDTRVVMACLDTAHHKYPCYTFGSMFRESFDIREARRVAAACGQTYRVIVLGTEFLSDFPRYMEEAVYLSDGYIGFSGAGELYANRIARTIAPIRLTGNYGSELLRGVRGFKSELPAAGFFSSDLDGLLENAQSTFEEIGRQHPVSFALFEQAPLQGFGRRSVEESQVVLRTPFMDINLAKLVYQKPPAAMGSREEYLAILERYRPDLKAIPTDRGELGEGGPLRVKARKANRVALAKAEYWADHGMPQLVATISARMPWLLPAKKLIGYNKFQHYRLWLRQDLSSYVRDILLPFAQTSAYLDRKRLGSMVESHVQGSRNFTHEIDLALTLALCEKKLLQ